MESDLQKLRIDKGHKARRDQRSLWPWGMLVLLLAGGSAGVWQWRKVNAAVAVETIRVRVPEGTAQESDLVLLDATGYIMAAHRIELASKVVGRVAWVGVEMGDKAKKDQVLVRLEDDEYKARVAQEKGQLENAKARLTELKAGSRPQEIAQALAQLDKANLETENARRSLERLKEVRGDTTLSKQEIDDAETLVKTREAQAESIKQQYELMKAGPRKEQIAAQEATVSQLEGSLAMASVDLDNTVIRAPVAATILERNVEVGEFVTNGFVGDRGAKGYVVSIADLNDLLVELDVSQDNFAKVEMAQPCWITTDAYPDRKYDGNVELISPVANRQKATIQVRVKVKNPDSFLKPDMNAKVSFLSQKKLAAAPGAATAPEERPLIRVPSSALHDGAIFVVESGKAVRRNVALGNKAANGDVEVRKGLIGGEDLIVRSAKALQDGDPVTLSENNK